MNNKNVFDWDDEINNEDSFTIIPEGDYTFTVEKVERGLFDGSDKLPPCKKATVTFRIHAADSDVTLTDNFLLCSALEWKLSALFLSVGMKRHGEPLRMNWTGLPGCTGRCRVYIDKYTTKDGKSGEYNKIKKYYAYDEDVDTVQPAAKPTYTQPVQQYAAPASGGWQAGKF